MTGYLQTTFSNALVDMCIKRPGEDSVLQHICWFNFDALAQGNAYKLKKRMRMVMDGNAKAIRNHYQDITNIYMQTIVHCISTKVIFYN